MIVVSNSTPIISLSCIGNIGILKSIFGDIYIPNAVYYEIKSKNTYGYKEIDDPFFIRRTIHGTQYLGFLLNDLDKGEAEAIILSKELKADYLIIDERFGLSIAQKNGVSCLGTLSILKIAKEKGFVSKVKPLLDEMIRKGRWYSSKIYDEFLKSINE